MTIGVSIGTGDRPHRVFWQNPGPDVPDGEGGSTAAWVDCVPPATWCRIAAASAQTLERLGMGTVTSIATYEISGPYHPQITTATRGVFNGRRFSVTMADNVEERNVTTTAIAVEVVS